MSASKQLELIKKRIQVQSRLALTKIAKEVAPDVANLVRTRTQLEGEGASGKLSPLSESTKKQRRFYSDNLSEYTSPEQSNATATGQLIDSIQGKNIGTKIIVEPNKKKGRTTLSGGRSKLSNQEVLKWYEAQGREFLKLNDEEKKDLREYISKRLSEELAKRLK